MIKITGVGGIYDCRKDAVSVLVKQLDKAKEDPDVTWDLIKAAATVALGAATGGISGVIAGKIGARIGGGVAKATEDLLKEAVKGQLDTLAQRGVEEAKKRIPTGAPSEAMFLESQLQALNHAAQATADQLEQKRPSFYAASNGKAQAAALLQAYDASLDEAFDQQFVVSLAEWSRLVDLADRFEFGQPDAEDPGILGLEVEARDPAADFRITGAHLEDIPQESRQRLQKTGLKVKDLLGLGHMGKAGLVLRVVGEVGEYINSPRNLSRGRLFVESAPGNRGNPSYPKSGHGWYFLFQRGRDKYGSGDTDKPKGVPGPYSDTIAMVTANLVVNQEIGDLYLKDLPSILD